MKRELINRVFLGFAFFFIIAFVMFLVSFKIGFSSDNSIIGEEAIEFCADSCFGKSNVYFSLKNDTYSVIRCVCYEGLENFRSNTNTAGMNVKTKEYYFDSITFEEISREEYFGRVNG